MLLLKRQLPLKAVTGSIPVPSSKQQLRPARSRNQLFPNPFRPGFPGFFHGQHDFGVFRW